MGKWLSSRPCNLGGGFAVLISTTYKHVAVSWLTSMLQFRRKTARTACHGAGQSLTRHSAVTDPTDSHGRKQSALWGPSAPFTTTSSEFQLWRLWWTWQQTITIYTPPENTSPILSDTPSLLCQWTVPSESRVIQGNSAFIFSDSSTHFHLFLCFVLFHGRIPFQPLRSSSVSNARSRACTDNINK